MIRREKEIKVRLSDDEYASLNNKVRLCKCSREKYIRNVLNDFEIKMPLPIEYYQLLKEVNHIGNNLNQLVKLGYVKPLNEIDVVIVIKDINNIMQRIDNEFRGA
ncbi:hypothetical protein M2475_001942 [Breznakia sp. PF5-3]|uniref:plasmid mobilization protein n=1 Tax=unclassified Breznakia TaxID=2623764 RepID=UPI002405E88C|nr:MULTISPECIES: MbeCy [unclassified Breznakia]MDF9825477.1 hypothetical protein [Breznakia sp. PM6-1]MDF9836362.1 hypothetical protein [Breznakia sp. PF5-3]MDF9838932.1 hypothetical protein [Breznakia sp. PFB2-8]MDF9860960.1 hypothetical protein [Breznakia sp. PH5-24]